ncbi:MAG: hypothetical protein ABIH92_02440, partial [Nanoarchaeota archaeon]
SLGIEIGDIKFNEDLGIVVADLKPKKKEILEPSIKRPQEQPPSLGPTEKKLPGKKPQESLLNFEKPSKPNEPTAPPSKEEKPLLDLGGGEKSKEKKPEEKFDLEDLDESKFQLEGELGEKEPTLEEVLKNPAKMQLAPPVPLKPVKPTWTPRKKEKGITPSWYDPDDLIDPRTPEGKKKLEEKNFSTGSLTDSDGKPLEDIPSTTAFYNVYDGKSYSFDELPKELQDALRERQQNGELTMAPPVGPKDVPEEILEKIKAAMERAGKLSEKTIKKAAKPSKIVNKVSQFFRETGEGAENLYDFATSQLSKTNMVGKKIRDVIGSVFTKYFGARKNSLRAKSAKSLAASIESRILLSFIADRIASAELWRLAVKDKDLIQDTGGKSKGRQIEPKVKPPRDDLKIYWRKRRLKPSEMDLDTQRDPDIDDDPDMRL